MAIKNAPMFIVKEMQTWSWTELILGATKKKYLTNVKDIIYTLILVVTWSFRPIKKEQHVKAR